MSNFLLIDTSAAKATVALGSDGQVIAYKYLEGQKEQAGRLNLLIEEILIDGGIELAEVDAFCLCAGPGSYTGLRVSMGGVKGMAFALHKPIIALNRLQLIALSCRARVPMNGRCYVLLKARKGEYFGGLFSANGEPVMTPRHLFDIDLEGQWQAGDLLVTDVVETLALQGAKLLEIEKNFTPDVSAWLALTQQHYQQQLFVDLAQAEPFYLKPAYTTSPKK